MRLTGWLTLDLRRTSEQSSPSSRCEQTRKNLHDCFILSGIHIKWEEKFLLSPWHFHLYFDNTGIINRAKVQKVDQQNQYSILHKGSMLTWVSGVEHIVGNFRELVENVIFIESCIAHWFHQKTPWPQIIMEKNFANSHKTSKFVKVFFFESFTLYRMYGRIWCKCGQISRKRLQGTNIAVNFVPCLSSCFVSFASSPSVRPSYSVPPCPKRSKTSPRVHSCGQVCACWQAVLCLHSLFQAPVFKMTTDWCDIMYVP